LTLRYLVPFTLQSAGERDLIVDNIGLPARSYNYAFSDGTATGANDGVILIALKEDHKPTANYVKKLRQVLATEFPEDVFYFQAADMVTQILNFSIPSQINVRTVCASPRKCSRRSRQFQASLTCICNRRLMPPSCSGA
jgi:hypothetical protein